MSMTATLTLAELLRATADRADQMEHENGQLHRLCHVLARQVCTCPPGDGSGYRELNPECLIHRMGGLEDLLETARVIQLPPEELTSRRHLLRAFSLAQRSRRRNCNCRLHGGHPKRRPYAGCPKHGTATAGLCRHG